MKKKAHVQTEAEYHKERLDDFVNGGKTMGKRAERRAHSKAVIDDYKRAFAADMDENIKAGLPLNEVIEQLKKHGAEELNKTPPQQRHMVIRAFREFCISVQAMLDGIKEAFEDQKADLAKTEQ